MKKVWISLAIVGVIVAGVFGWRTYLVHELRKPVLAELNDPDSAKFRNEWLLFGWSAWMVKGSILCGEVNSKNRMGGYSGYVKFSSNSGIDTNIGDDKYELGSIELTCKQ